MLYVDPVHHAGKCSSFGGAFTVRKWRKMLPKLTATQFDRFMDSGRTSPALFACRDERDRPCGEYVIKLTGSIGHPGSINELVGNRLVSHFEISCLEPALISIERELAGLAAAIRPEKASMLISSEGLNFGTKAVAGFST